MQASRCEQSQNRKCLCKSSSEALSAREQDQNWMWVSITWSCKKLLSQSLCLWAFDWQVRGNAEEVCGPRVLQQRECHPSSERSAHSRAVTQSWDASQMHFISRDVYLYWWSASSTCPCVSLQPLINNTNYPATIRPVLSFSWGREGKWKRERVGRRGKYGQEK